jgi:hypothetical protein
MSAVASAIQHTKVRARASVPLHQRQDRPIPYECYTLYYTYMYHVIWFVPSMVTKSSFWRVNELVIRSPTLCVIVAGAGLAQGARSVGVLVTGAALLLSASVVMGVSCVVMVVWETIEEGRKTTSQKVLLHKSVVRVQVLLPVSPNVRGSNLSIATVRRPDE